MRTAMISTSTLRRQVGGHIKRILIAICVLSVFLANARQLSAQPRHGFVTVGIHPDLNQKRFPGAGGGVLFDLLDSWISVGAQVDLFGSGCYVAERGCAGWAPIFFCPL